MAGLAFTRASHADTPRGVYTLLTKDDQTQITIGRDRLPFCGGEAGVELRKYDGLKVTYQQGVVVNGSEWILRQDNNQTVIARKPSGVETVIVEVWFGRDVGGGAHGVLVYEEKGADKQPTCATAHWFWGKHSIK